MCGVAYPGGLVERRRFSLALLDTAIAAKKLEAHALPFFLDPEQVAALTPEIDWDERVGQRIRSLLEWGAKRGVTPNGASDLSATVGQRPKPAVKE